MTDLLFRILLVASALVLVLAVIDVVRLIRTRRAYAAPTIAADVNRWSINRGLPQITGSQLTQVVAPRAYHHPESGTK